MKRAIGLLLATATLAAAQQFEVASVRISGANSPHGSEGAPGHAPAPAQVAVGASVARGIEDDFPGYELVVAKNGGVVPSDTERKLTRPPATGAWIQWAS